MAAKYLFGQYVLCFSNLPYLAYICIIILILFKNRMILFESLYLASFSIILNAMLKCLYKISLSPELGKIGYSFPSGHMQFTVVLYGYLCLVHRSNIVKLLTLLIISASGWALVLFGFHNLEDILGAVILGAALLFVVIDQPRFPTKAIFAATSICLSILTFMTTIKLYLVIPYCFVIFFMIVKYYSGIFCKLTSCSPMGKS